MPRPADHPSRPALAVARRVLLLLVAVAVGVLGVAPAVPAQAATIGGLAGSGTAADPLLIGSAADLDAAAAAVNADFATYGSLAYALADDIDYAGATFAGFDMFSGVFDGAGHSVSDVVHTDAADYVGFFRVLDGATVSDLTLSQVRATTVDGDGTVGALAARAYSSTITGVTVMDSAVALGAGGAVNTQASGLVGGVFADPLGGGTGTSTLTGNVVWNTAVRGHKYAAALVAYPNAAIGSVVISDNLVIGSTVVSAAGGGGATASALIAQRGNDNLTLRGNVVRGGSVSRSGSGTVTAIGPAAGEANYTDNLVSTSTVLGSGSVPGATGTPATTDPAAEPALPDLTVQATYEALGWDFTADTGAWRWSTALGHPVRAAAVLPGYAVTYDAAGGSAADGNPGSYTVESDGFTLVNPTRDHYDFAGWTGTGLGSPTATVTVPTGSTGDRSYVATWTPTAFAIGYDLAGGTGSGSNPTDYTVESEAITLANPTRTGYRFAGWTGTGLTGPTTDVTVPAGSSGDRAYVATWSGPVGFTLGYDLAGGTVDGSNPTDYTVESEAITLANPTRTGYRFAGWTGTGLTGPTTEVTVPAGSSGDRAYVATWTPVGYPLTYDLAGGRVGDGNRATYTVETAEFTLLNPRREGYRFAGWTGTGLTGPTTPVAVPTGSTGARAYAATWTPVAYALSYDLGGGSVTGSNPDSYTIETALELVNPSRTGHRFAGWVGTGLTGPAMTVTVPVGSTGDRTFAATWTPVAAPAPAKVGTKVVLKAPKARHRGGKQRRPRAVLVAVRPRAGTAAPTGRVRLRATTTVRKTVRGQVRKVTVTRSRTVTVRSGRFKVRLPRQVRSGRWKLRAAYAGDLRHRASTSPTLVLRLKR